jgi:hypothetical protein
MRINAAFVTSTLVVLVGCGTDPLVVCPLRPVPAIRAEVRSQSTGELLLGATGGVRDGEYSDALVSLGPGLLAGAYDRPGTYTVTVQKEGFSPWTASGVTASMSSCSVNTVELTARLSPIS